MVTTERFSQLAAWTSRLAARLPGRYRHFLAGTLSGTYLLMLLGAYTSAIGASLACPDWPTCYGTWIPFVHPEIVAEATSTGLQIAAEWVHRTVAAIVGVAIVGSAIWTWLDAARHALVK